MRGFGSVRDSRSQVTVLPGRLGAETLSPVINDPNGLTCLTLLDGLKESIVLPRPIAGLPSDPRSDRGHEPALHLLPLDTALADKRKRNPARARTAAGPDWARATGRAGCTSARYAPAAVSFARPTGGIRTSSSGRRPACCRPTFFIADSRDAAPAERLPASSTMSIASTVAARS